MKAKTLFLTFISLFAIIGFTYLAIENAQAQAVIEEVTEALQ